MAYTHSKYEVDVRQADGTALADMGAAAGNAVWAPGYMPHILRAVALVFTEVCDAVETVTITKRVTAGSDTDEETIDVITTTVADSAAGEVMYVDGLDVEIAPGEELQVTWTSAGSTGIAHIKAYVEPRWETPANLSNMTESA
jgi:hypothetical protein